MNHFEEPKWCQSGDIKSPEFEEFRHYFRQQFGSDRQEYLKQMRVLQSRPELIPYFMSQFYKQQNGPENKLVSKGAQKWLE